MTSPPIDLSIVIPAYNEARRIGVSLATLSDHLKAHDLGTVEVLVVVARGHDRTADLARAAADEFDTFRVIDAGTPAGKGRTSGSACRPRTVATDCSWTPTSQRRCTTWSRSPS